MSEYSVFNLHYTTRNNPYGRATISAQSVAAAKSILEKTIEEARIEHDYLRLEHCTIEATSFKANKEGIIYLSSPTMSYPDPSIMGEDELPL